MRTHPGLLAALAILPLSSCDRGEEPPRNSGAPAATAPVGRIAPAADGFAPIVKLAAPAVVSVAVLQSAPDEQNPLLRDPFFRRFFDQGAELQQPRLAAGSGVIVDGQRGLILTNHHVVVDARAIEITLPDRRRFEAVRVGSDQASDIAVLRVRGERLPQLPLGNSDRVSVGDQVLAIGNPFGLGQTVTSGIVSATGRTMSAEGFEHYIQTDAAINPGNSGGPLIAMNGTVIGINSAIFGPGANIGIGFAVPAATARFVLDEILDHGAVLRGQIGVVVVDAQPALPGAQPAPVGASIAAVEPRSAAARAGLRKGDVIVSAAGYPTPTALALRDLVGRTKIGSHLRLEIRRGSESLTASVQVHP